MGPLPPGASSSGTVVVHPHTGALWVEVDHGDGVRRNWNGAAWGVGADRLTPESAPVGFVFDDTRLVSAPTHKGGAIRHTYDDAGRLTQTVWPSGAAIAVAYDESGRVVSLTGPGPSRWLLSWNDGLRVRDPLGRPLDVDVEDRAGKRRITVTDALGRTTRSRLSSVEGGGWRLDGWQDPRGLDTFVSHRAGRVEVQDPAGRVWRIRTDESGRVEEASLPNGQRWRWVRSATGQVNRIDDPVGRLTRWERDDAGRIVAVTRGGHLTRYRRDGSGRVDEIVSPTGAVTRLERDEAGRIAALHDAVGNTIFFKRHDNGWPATIIGRTGGQWTLALDSLGRPERIEDPVGRAVKLQRDAAGRLVRLSDTVHGEVRLDRTADGHLSRVTDALGRTLGLVHNSVGHVTGIQRPDGTSVALSRNLAGDVVAVTIGDDRTEVARNPVGQPMRVGEVSWDRDIAGQVKAIRRPGRVLQLTRDPSGGLNGVRAGTWAVTIQRDGAGWPVSWTDGGTEVSVQRDPGGRVMVERAGERKITLSRSSLGDVDRVIAGADEWRWMRDASGRVLRIHGPEDVRIGFDRDDAGRLTLVRYPSGALLRRVYDDARIQETLRDRAEAVIEVRNTVTNVDGEVESITNEEGEGWTWHRDPLGQVVSVERTDGRAWSWTMDSVVGPDGELFLLDETGRMIEAHLGAGSTAWGVAEETMSLHRDPFGRMDRISGDAGAVDLRFGFSGALIGAVGNSSGERWSIVRDPRGRVARVQRGAEAYALLWHPDAREGRVWDLLATATEASTTKRMLGPEGGGAVWTGTPEAGVVEELVVDAAGAPAWKMGKDVSPTALAFTPQGRAQSAVPGGFGLGGWWQAWPGGPMMVRGVAVDPVSGERVDGTVAWPWAPSPVRSTDGSDRVDPAAWAPESPWSRPLVLLESLGMLEDIDTGGWWAPPSDPLALDWLPASLDAVAPPLGPQPHGLPLEPMDPVTAAFVRAVLPGGEPPAADLPVYAILAEELQLPWLPPGIALPGLDRWRVPENSPIR